MVTKLTAKESAMKPKLPLVTLFAASALLLAACKFQATTEVKPDGSSELRTEVGFTAEERQNLENQSGGNPSQNFCNDPQASPDAAVSEEQRGDETWCITTTKFDHLDELRRLYEEQKGLTIRRLEIEGGKFYYDIDVDTSSKDSSFSAFTAISWTVILPGTPITHNAPQSEGNTLTWTLEPRSGTINLHAESSAPAPISALPLLMVSAGLCGAALLGGVVVFFLLRRRPKATGATT